MPSIDAGANLSAYYQETTVTRWRAGQSLHMGANQDDSRRACGNTKARQACMQGAAARAWCCNRLWRDCIGPLCTVACRKHSILLRLNGVGSASVVRAVLLHDIHDALSCVCCFELCATQHLLGTLFCACELMLCALGPASEYLAATLVKAVVDSGLQYNHIPTSTQCAISPQLCRYQVSIQHPQRTEHRQERRIRSSGRQLNP